MQSYGVRIYKVICKLDLE